MKKYIQIQREADNPGAILSVLGAYCDPDKNPGFLLKMTWVHVASKEADLAPTCDPNAIYLGACCDSNKTAVEDS